MGGKGNLWLKECAGGLHECSWYMSFRLGCSEMIDLTAVCMNQRTFTLISASLNLCNTHNLASFVWHFFTHHGGGHAEQEEVRMGLAAGSQAKPYLRLLFA
jgi:hypothetical protein